MSQKRSERLKAVLRMAELRQQHAAKLLANCQAQVDGATQQQQQLRDYQQEYDRDWQSRDGEPRTASQLMNFQNFYRNLELAVDAQGQQLEMSSQQLERARQHWRERYGYRRAIDMVQSGLREEELMAVEKQLQREADDRPLSTPWSS